MGNISVTFADRENGVISASYKIADEGMKRIYDALKKSYEDIENQDVGQLNEDGEEIRAVTVSPNDVVNRLSLFFVDSVINSAVDSERKIIYAKMNMQPIKIESDGSK